MLLNSLRFKLTAGVAMLIAISIGSMTLIGWYSMSSSGESAVNNVRQSLGHIAQTILTAEARVTALETAALLNRNYDVAKNLASLMANTADGSGQTPYSREQVQELARHQLQANPRVSSIYTQYEVNGYDNRDSEVSDEINRNITAIGDATRELEGLAQQNLQISSAIDQVTERIDNQLSKLRCD